MDYVCYYRVSTSSQGRSGLGLDAQTECVRNYVARNDGIVKAEFTEVESGKSASRVELEKAIRYCKLTNSRLIISTISRLTRDVHFLTGLQKSGVDFVCCDMPDANPMTIQLMAVMAESEAKNISMRTRDALAAAKSRGVKLGNPNLDKVRNIDTSKANKTRSANADAFALDVMAEITNIFSEEGIVHPTLIAELLNEKGIKTRKNKEWTRVQVSRVMKRVANIRGKEWES